MQVSIGLGAAGQYYTALFESIISLGFVNAAAAVPLLLPRGVLEKQLEAECAKISFPQIYDGDTQNKAAKLEDKYRNGVALLSSVSLQSIPLDEIRVLRERSSVSVTEIYDLLKRCDELPAPMAAILVAGWNTRIAEASKTLAELRGEVAKDTMDSAALFAEYSDRSQEWDKSIMKSIESAQVHKILLD